MIKRISFAFIFILLAVAVLIAYRMTTRYFYEKNILNQIIERLSADTRVAQVLVSKVEFDPKTNKNMTTIKFIEFDNKGHAQEPRYFTFAGNILQFQSLVIRFDDKLVRYGDKLKGKSAYIFWKVFMLDGKDTQEFEINRFRGVPQGYKIANLEDPFEEKLWGRFWDYAMDSAGAHRDGVKNAQIEAPGTIFVPGTLYTIKIEHDGGLRIDTIKIPDIFRGEKIP